MESPPRKSQIQNMKIFRVTIWPLSNFSSQIEKKEEKKAKVGMKHPIVLFVDLNYFLKKRCRFYSCRTPLTLVCIL